MRHLPRAVRHRRRSGRPRRYRRVAAVRVLVAALAAGVLAAPAASAHVTVNPREAPRGGYAALAFRVPNERPDANTTELRVSFPEEHPLRSVRVKPHPGWTYEIETRELDEPLETEGGEEVTEVVSTITWSGGEITPEQYEEFEVSVGPLPEDADEIMFPSIQVYDSGEEVEWIEEPPAEGGEEPERPAPLLTLVDPEGEGGGGAAADQEQASGLSVENAATQDDVDSANRLAFGGLVVGIIGVVAAAVALVRGRRAEATPAPSSTTPTTPTSTDA